MGMDESAAHADICHALGAGAVRLEKRDAIGVVCGCADNGGLQGSGVGWLGKKRLVCGRWQKVG